MALNIDAFGFLSDSEVSKLSPMLKEQQPPVSPIESESSSGISSLDSDDDLKKQMPSSPAIPHDDDEDQQSEGTNEAATSDGKGDESSTDENEADDEAEDEVQKTEGQSEDKKTTPMKKMFFARDLVDDLADNVVGPSQIVQFTVLPENNVNCFFQNRAQYWRLSSGERQEYSLEKCPCCDFTYPSTQQPLNQGPMAASKTYNANAVTESLLTFLKSTEQVSPVMSNNPGKRFGMQPPIQPTPYQYQAPNSGFYNNNNNNNNNSYNYNQQMNPFMNNGSGYGTTLALLNLMNNASRNAANAFQAMNNSNNTPRYYNNNSSNNGYGLYKQF